MASMSVSNSNSLGNTSLRGFGGMASGIDRDAIIEQMSLGTQTKINSQKSKMTKLEWKRDAYRALTDQVYDLQDKYFSYSSSNALKDPALFGRTNITANGVENSKRFVTAKGKSDMIDSLAIMGVKQLATSTVLQSNTHIADSIKSKELDLSQTGLQFRPTLENKKLDIRTIDGDGYQSDFIFDFVTEYTDASGAKQTIDYTPKDDDSATSFVARLVTQLNGLAENNQVKDKIKFVQNGDKLSVELLEENKVIHANSTALEALGYKKETINGSDLGSTEQKDFWESGLQKTKNTELLSNRNMVFEYDGVQKNVMLMTKEEAAAIDKAYAEGDGVNAAIQAAMTGLQSRLDKAFGTMEETGDKVTNGIKVDIKQVDNKYQYEFTTREGSTVSLMSYDNTFLKNFGVDFGASNKVNVSGKLDQDALKRDGTKLNVKDYLDDKDELDLTINGERIYGLKKDSTIQDIISKINSNEKVGVKATYVDATGQFMLVASETGSGRDIQLNSLLAKDLFNGTETKGKDAEIEVSYGNGAPITIKRASNSFTLDGLDVTVTGEFGYVTNSNGDKVLDSSQKVTFTATADVDKAVETVKTFFEDFNKLITNVRTEVTTRPDSSYGPLTSEQKAEMDDTSIENWEKKAKAGILYGDDVMRDFSGALEGIMGSYLRATKMDYEKLKDIGITYSEDYLDGGTLVFDESKFRKAMESDPDLVSKIMVGGDSGNGGFAKVVEDTLTPYATRYASKNGNSYGRLVEIAGTEKKPTTLMSNQIYKELKSMQEQLDKLNSLLKTEQDRYIKQFSTMESLINTMNTQSSYLSQIMA